MIVILDNRDSFVFNLARYFVLLGAQVKVLPSHETDLEEIQSAKPTSTCHITWPVHTKRSRCFDSMCSESFGESFRYWEFV